jgi:hypothetical protein
MNAVEIEEAVSELAGRPFHAAEFPYAFLAAFGNKDTTIKRLRAGNTNASDVPGGVLQRNHIHIAVCADGQVSKTITALRESPKTEAAKAKFVLATDGVSLEAEDLTSGETIACAYDDFAKHFGFFLPLAGISTVKEIKNNPFDIKATGRLNKLYVQLLKDNPDWAEEAKRPALNQFIARLIFCFFAEDTGIFRAKQFTKIVEQMSDGQSGNTHEVLCELFRAMDIKSEDREKAKIKSWANDFPYVNGGMFAGGAECPTFSKIARSYLLAVGGLEWDKINPDIFGSMIQAVADDDERGEIGMHYTSVPNILKVLNPLFLDDLREHLKSADDNVRKLKNLRKRLSTIRVFDPACGSGNFLVIAYKEMRAIEHEIVRRTGDEPKSWIKLDNFYGIEIKNFAVEIARLALLIAEFQSDVQFISQQEARAMVLPLHRTGQIHTENALRVDWLRICPPVAKSAVEEFDLAGPTGRFALEDNSLTELPDPETYICGNPPYKGTKNQTKFEKSDLELVFSGHTKNYGSLDYVAAWFLKAALYSQQINSRFALVTTNSICQGGQAPILWPVLSELGCEIFFAYESFKWTNLASKNAGVTVAIVGVRQISKEQKRLFRTDADQRLEIKEVSNINAYLIAGPNILIAKSATANVPLGDMDLGNAPYDGGHLILDANEIETLQLTAEQRHRFIRPLLGSAEIIEGRPRHCIWIDDEHLAEAQALPALADRIEKVREMRVTSKDAGTNAMARKPHQFREMKRARQWSIGVPIRSSENRPYLPVDLLKADCCLTNLTYALYDAPLFNLAVIASRLHLVWIAAVCGKLETRFSYSNKMGWNTFPLPTISEQNLNDLTESAKQILLAREAHFPKNISDLYDPEEMPDDLRRAHEANDDIIERIYIGRRFRNDTERLEKLFELYIKTNTEKPKSKSKAKRVA